MEQLQTGAQHTQTSVLSTQVTQAIAKRESDLVTPMARAAAYINPKYVPVYGEERFECPRSAECFGEGVQDFLLGTLKGSPDDRAALQTDILLEAANFRKLRGWFASDAARRVATVKSEFDFWTIAAQYDDAKNLSSLA